MMGAVSGPNSDGCRLIPSNKVNHSLMMMIESRGGPLLKRGSEFAYQGRRRRLSLLIESFSMGG